MPTWGNCIERILAEAHPTIRAVSPMAYIKQTGYPAQPFAVALAASTAQRAGLLAVLEALPPEDWSRAATVTAVGKPLEKSVHYDAQRLAKHERGHVGQIERVVGVVRG